MSETLIITSILSAYLVILLAIAYWSHREAGTLEDYFVGGRRLPFWVASFSANATGESGWLLLGLTGMGYLVGIHALWVVLGETVGMYLAWRLVARRLKIAADRYGSVTVSDYLDDRFEDRSQIIRVVGSVIILSMVAAYVTAQMMATGKAFSTFLPMEYSTGVLIGGVITLAYTAYGGFKAVAYSDVLQGVLMLAGLVILPIAGFYAVQGDVWEQLGAADARLLAVDGGLGFGVAGLIAIVSFIAVGLPFAGAPQMLTRYMAIRDPNEIPKARTISVLCILTFGVGAVMTGLVGRVLFPGLDDAETIMPTMARELFPAPITALFLVIVLAAVMSTVDALLILASSALVRDLLQRAAKVRWTDARFVTAGQIATAGIGVGAILFAFAEPQAIFWLVLFVQNGLASAFGPPVICALFLPGITKRGALAGMVGGFATTIIWATFIKPYVYDLFELIPALIVSFALTIYVSRATQPDAR